MDLRALRTKENLHNVFIEMLSEKDYEKITITEICKRAKIDRKTFYSHYNNLNSLLEEMQQETAEKFIERTKNFQCPKDMDKVTREFFLCTEELGKLGEKLNRNHLGKQIKDKIMSETWKFSNANKNPYHQNIIMSFVSEATLAIYRQWVDDGKKIPLDDIIGLASDLICKGVNGIKN